MDSPLAFSGIVALLASIVNVAEPVDMPPSLPITELAPIGWTLKVKGTGVLYKTSPPAAIFAWPVLSERLIEEFSGVTRIATGADELAPNTPSPP